MATSKQEVDYMEDFICAICLELLHDPVILECRHNFCKSCINKAWDNEKQPSCPVCRTGFSARKFTEDPQLAAAVERVQRLTARQQKKKRAELVDKEGCDHCVEHEKMELFCQEDETLVCTLCIAKHPNHSFLTLQKAFGLYKETLTTSLAHLESQLKVHTQTKYQQYLKISEVTTNAMCLEQHITSEFAELHKFLRKTEQKLIQQLREEEKEIVRLMEENLDQIKETIHTIQESISTISVYLQQHDAVTFLKDLKVIMKRWSESQKESIGLKAKLVSEDLNWGVYKGPIQYNTWKEMISVVKPGVSSLTMDPNTAHPDLILSSDLTSVHDSNVRNQLPDNPERFNSCGCVLGAEGFTSGKHYWEIEVGYTTSWDIGVVRKSINRKGNLILCPEQGYWVVGLWNENEYIAWCSPVKRLRVNRKPQKIGVYLDYDAGQVSFYIADNMCHLYTFSDTFTEMLHPFFSPSFADGCKNANPLKLFHLKL